MAYMSFVRVMGGYRNTLVYTKKEIQRYDKELSRYFKYIDEWYYLQHKKISKQFVAEKIILTKQEVVDLFRWKRKNNL